MFLDNKYTKWYYGIIQNAKNREGKTEKHHIIPKCLGGTNEKINLINLSVREHVLVHWLLTKMTKGRDRHKMMHAFDMMNRETSKKTRQHKIKSTILIAMKRSKSIALKESRIGKTFEEIYGDEKAKEIRKKISERMKLRIGDKNQFYGKHHTPETKQILSEKQKKYVETHGTHKHTEETKCFLRQQRMGGKNPSAVKCEILGTTYETILEASKQINVHKDTILYRINSTNDRWKNWKRI